MIDKYLANLAVYLGVAGLFWILHRLFARRGPARLRPDGGAIRPSGLLISQLLLAGLFLVSGAGYSLLLQGQNAIALGVLAGAIGMILIALFMTGDENEVTWSNEGVRGPGFLPFLPGVSRAVQMTWDDIRRSGETRLHLRYVEDQNGRRIYWHRHYPGHGVLEKMIAKRRPDLFQGASARAFFS